MVEVDDEVVVVVVVKVDNVEVAVVVEEPEVEVMLTVIVDVCNDEVSTPTDIVSGISVLVIVLSGSNGCVVSKVVISKL